MGKKFVDVKKKIDLQKEYSLESAIEFLKGNSTVSFDETVEIAVNLGVDSKKTSDFVRGNLILPKGSGKKNTIAVICDGSKFQEARDNGADIVGGQDLIDRIKQKDIDFDVCICSKDMIFSISSVAKILGPKGLMPNVKLGTVTDDIGQTVKNFTLGQIEYRMDKYSIVHSRVGKISFLLEDLVENIKFFIKSVMKSKPVDFKGVFLKKIHLSSSMGIGIKVGTSSVL